MFSGCNAPQEDLSASLQSLAWDEPLGTSRKLQADLLQALLSLRPFGASDPGGLTPRLQSEKLNTFLANFLLGVKSRGLGVWGCPNTATARIHELSHCAAARFNLAH